MKRYFYVDTENVHTHGLKGVEKLTAEDTVVIFLGPNNYNMRLEFDLAMRLRESKAKIGTWDTQVSGNNAMDFQIAGVLGRQARPGIEQYVITRNEKDYRAVLELASRLGTEKTGCYADLEEAVTGRKEVPIPQPARRERQPKNVAQAQPTQKKATFCRQTTARNVLQAHGLKIDKKGVADLATAVSEGLDYADFRNRCPKLGCVSKRLYAEVMAEAEREKVERRRKKKKK